MGKHPEEEEEEEEAATDELLRRTVSGVTTTMTGACVRDTRRLGSGWGAAARGRVRRHRERTIRFNTFFLFLSNDRIGAQALSVSVPFRFFFKKKCSPPLQSRPCIPASNQPALF